MPGTKEIRTKIASVKSTQKITKAMQMVATSKMRRAQDRMKLARPYADKIRSVIGNLQHANPDYRHPFMASARSEERRPHRDLHRSRPGRRPERQPVQADAVHWCANGRTRARRVSLCLIGSKGTAFFRRLSLPILASVSGMGDKPHVNDLIGTRQGHARRVSRGQDRPAVPGARRVREHHDAEAARRPAAAGGAFGQGDSCRRTGTTSTSRARRTILDGLLMRYIESQVYRGAVENVASEMAARMVAMKAATDNAGKLISELQLVYNKARQAAITKELAEIVGGAAAV